MGLHYDCFHTRAKCAIWIWIRNAHFELKFERQYFGPCVRQITSRCVIWNAHFKWRSGGVFKLHISQITQGNHCMNALTSNRDFYFFIFFLGGGGAELSDLLTTSAYIPRAACVQKHRKCELCACLIGRVPRHSFPAGMQNPKSGLSCVHCIIQISQWFVLSCVHCIIQISQWLLSCVHCLIQMIIQIYALCSRVKTVLDSILVYLYWFVCSFYLSYKPMA